MTGCHTIKHKNLFLVNNNIKVTKPINGTKKDDIKVKIIPKIIISDDKVSETNLKLVNESEKMIPVSEIKLKKVVKKIDLKILENLSENELYTKISEGDFIKQEGKLKNIQYYFTECFLDVFLINKNNVYITDFIQIRSTKLNSFLDKERCLIEIANKFK